MSSKLIDYREHDKNFWYEELEEWVPKRIYDCHAHMLLFTTLWNDLIGEPFCMLLFSW